jgi:hypothetical protein
MLFAAKKRDERREDCIIAMTSLLDSLCAVARWLTHHDPHMTM